MRITVLSGGVGAARLLRGLSTVVAPESITALVNTGDDLTLHGLAISPDLDTITYTLAGAIDSQRGWGLTGETWDAVNALRRYESVRPPNSTAAATWFGLGDQDLATHLYRTARLAEGATLTEVTAEITRAWGLAVTLAPMTNDRFRTRVTLAETGATVSFQDYFVRLGHQAAISAITFDHLQARATPAALDALDAERIIVAPSNPFVSIGPIRELDEIEQRLRERRESVVAVSPIVGGAALKGPADRMLSELGWTPSVESVAALYCEIAATLIIDPVDAHLASAVERYGMRCVVTPSVMSTPARSADLARQCLSAGY